MGKSDPGREYFPIVRNLPRTQKTDLFFMQYETQQTHEFLSPLEIFAFSFLFGFRFPFVNVFQCFI